MGKPSRRKQRKLDRRIEKDPIGVLHDEVCFRSREEAMPFIAGTSRHTKPGCLTLAFTDEHHRLVDMLVVDGGGDNIRQCVEIACGIVMLKARGLLLISDRSGEVPADRPDDELLWLELVQIAKDQRITLYDWMITWGTKAYSVAEFAPIAAQWAA